MAWLIVQQDSTSGEFNLSSSKADVVGSSFISPQYITETATIANNTSLVYCDMVLTSQVLTLPLVADNENMLLRIKNRGVNSFTIEGAGVDTIDDQALETLNEKEALTLHADDDDNWNIL